MAMTLYTPRESVCPCGTRFLKDYASRRYCDACRLARKPIARPGGTLPQKAELSDLSEGQRNVKQFLARLRNAPTRWA